MKEKPRKNENLLNLSKIEASAWQIIGNDYDIGQNRKMLAFMIRSEMLYNSESNGGPFSKVVFKS